MSCIATQHYSAPRREFEHEVTTKLEANLPQALPSVATIPDFLNYFRSILPRSGYLGVWGVWELYHQQLEAPGPQAVDLTITAQYRGSQIALMAFVGVGVYQGMPVIASIWTCEALQGPPPVQELTPVTVYRGYRLSVVLTVLSIVGLFAANLNNKLNPRVFTVTGDCLTPSLRVSPFEVPCRGAPVLLSRGHEVLSDRRFSGELSERHRGHEASIPGIRLFRVITASEPPVECLQRNTACHSSNGAAVAQSQRFADAGVTSPRQLSWSHDPSCFEVITMLGANLPQALDNMCCHVTLPEDLHKCILTSD